MKWDDSVTSSAGAAFILATLAPILSAAPARAQEAPPETRRSDVVEVLHGTRVTDPYRWLEDMTSPEVMRWARAQDAHARSLIATEGRPEELRERIAAASDHEIYTSPLRGGGLYFYSRMNSSATRVAIMVREGLQGEGRILVDPDTTEAAGLVLDRSFWPSPDGRIVAYGVSEPGSRWVELRFRNVDTGRDLPDRVQGLHGPRPVTVSWASDGSGIWYDAFDLPAPGERLSAALIGSRVVFHELGTPTEQDRTLVAAPDGSIVAHQGTDDGRWLVVRQDDGVGYDDRVLVLDTRRPNAAPQVLIEDPGAPFSLVGSRGDEVWLYTTRGAPNGRVVGVNVGDPAPERWRTVVPEREDPIDTWTGAVAVGDVIVTGYRSQGALELRISEPESGESVIVPLPRLGSIWFGVTGRQGIDEFFYQLSGFADPGTIFRHDLAREETAVFLAPELPYDPTEIITRQVFYAGPAGERIPMYLAHLSAVRPDGTHPVMLYGYAFGNWSASPWFRPHMGVWFEMGGVFALPALRGGGEFGTDWAEQGLRTRRQNAVDDFVSAARWLVDEGLASPELMVAETNSAGASVVGAAVVQEPELFGAAIFGFPLLDVLRYDRFTGGRQWRSQLGSATDAEEFQALLGYSPVHNIESGTCYAPTLVTPGEKDEITPPFHAYKFVAALQAGQTCDAPALLRLSWGAGHTYGRDQDATVENFADQLAFLRMVLDGWSPEGVKEGVKE